MHTQRSGRAAAFSLLSACGGLFRGRGCSGVLWAGVVPWRGEGAAVEGCYGASTLFYALPPAYVEPRVETRWRPRASLRKLIPRGFSYHFRCTRVMLLAPSIHDLFSLLFPFFFPSFHPSTAPSLFSSHPCRDRHPTVIRPSARTLPTSVHGRYRIIPISPSSFLSGQKRKKKKLQTTSQDVLPGWYHPCAKALLFALTRLLLFLASEPAQLCFFIFSVRKLWLHSENLLIQSYFIHPTLALSSKTIFVRSFMKMLKERVAVNMGMYSLFIPYTDRTLTWRLGISSQSLP